MSISPAQLSEPACETEEPARADCVDAGGSERAAQIEGKLSYDSVVTIDGPAGTGKSTVSRALAHRLGYDFLDTGAMYRGITALALDHSLALHDEQAIADLARKANLRFAWGDDPPMLTAFAASITHRLRDDDVTSAVSMVSGLPSVREVMVESQQRIGREHPKLVTEGRDQGSVVFPDARVKLYLDASAGVRAKRRAAQLEAQGRTDVCVEQIERDIIARDSQDSSREVAPLVCPEGARRVNTDDLTEAQVIDLLERLVREGLGHDRAEHGAS